MEKSNLNKPTIEDRHEEFQDFSQKLNQFGKSAPSAQLETVANNTTALSSLPQHTIEVANVANKAHDVLQAALPVNPNPSPMGLGHDDWKPSNSQLLHFEQIKKAVTDPHQLIKDFADGNLPTMAQWQAFNTVYPEMAKDLANEAVKYIGEHNDQRFTQKQRTGLSMMAGYPISNTLNPKQIAFQQGIHAPQQMNNNQNQQKPRDKGLDELSIAKDTAWSPAAPGASENSSK